MSGVFTEVYNISIESGLTKAQAATLILYSAIPEVSKKWSIFTNVF